MHAIWFNATTLPPYPLPLAQSCRPDLYCKRDSKQFNYNIASAKAGCVVITTSYDFTELFELSQNVFLL